MVIFAGRLRHRLLDRPSQFKDAPSKCALTDAETLRPIVQRQGFAAIRDRRDGAPVVALLFSGRPPHVSRLVVSFVVDAIDRARSAWSMADVGEKRFEGVAPAGADANSAPAVVVETLRSRIQAPILYRLPRVKLRRLRHAVRRLRTAVALGASAAARSRVTVPQVNAPYNGRSSAVALALKSQAPLDAFCGNAENRQRSEALAGGDLDWCRHSPFYPGNVTVEKVGP